MDLRIKKTKRAIRSAFYELIKEKPLEKITVREIAERAEINKTTFYAHYETVYDLVDQLEQETVVEVISQLNIAQGPLSSPSAFVKGNIHPAEQKPTMYRAFFCTGHGTVHRPSSQRHS